MNLLSALKNGIVKHKHASAAKTALPHHYYASTYMVAMGKPVWTSRNYARFADEAYIRNVVAHRSVSMIAHALSSVSWNCFARDGEGKKTLLKTHPLLSLLANPNPAQGGGEFMEAFASYYLISGNVFVMAAGPKEQAPRELHLLRPDRVQVIAGTGMLPAGYRYSAGEGHTDYPVDRITGRSSILHLKRFHPLDDWYGLSPIEAAAYSIDQHNQAGAWNQALLQNGARPSGALVVGAKEGPAHLSEEQYGRLKTQMDEQFSGPANAGRPLLLEGGLEWKEMSLSPKDMDFIEAKHSSARDIALAFGVPPQLLGIPGDNTYANLAEARLALWEQTILPLISNFADSLNGWLCPMVDEACMLAPDTDSISALAPRREALWNRLQQADFLTNEEKRTLAGVGGE